MEALLENQNQIMRGMDQLLSNFKKDGHDRKTPDMIRRRVETLDSYWQEFHANHVQLCTHGDQNFAYFTEKDYERTREFYNNARQTIVNYSKEVSRPSTPLIKPGTPFQSQPQANQPAAPAAPPRKTDGTNSKLEEMLRKQTSNFKAFSRTVSNISVSSLTEKWEFEDVLRTLQSRWTVIDSLHWEIDSEIDDQNQWYEVEFSRHEKTFNQIKKVVVGQRQIHIWSFEPDFNQMKKAINTKLWSASHRDKMIPHMDIPVFAGNYQQWTAFKDLFQEAIHNNHSLSCAQKLQFLKSKVRGEAEKLIQHLSISSDNYQVAWEILNHRYNNIKSIFTSYVNALLNIPVMQNQSSSHIKRLHDTTNECLHAIEKLGVDVSTWGPLLVHLLTQKLDADSHNDYVESLQKPRELPRIEDFLSFLETKFTSLEAYKRKPDVPKFSHQEENRFKKPIHQQAINNYYNKPSFKQSQFKSLHVESHKCLFCNQNHPLYYCKTFRESRPDVKRKTVAKFNLCKNCLFNHQGKECLSNKTCRDCNGKHNTLLHDALASPIEIPTNVTNLKTNQQKCNVSQENIAEILLSTAYVNVLAADGSYQKMRALIDQGSQTSLITENAAQLLQLQRQRCKGVIYGVGAKENNCKGVINVKLLSLHNDFTMTTDVIIMNTLINKLPNHSFKKPSWPYLNSIQLADSEFNTSRPVDMLLGADVYSSIIMSGIIKLDSHHPVAQETQLGWILCGNVKTYQCNVVINDTQDLQRFWEIEDITPDTSITAAEDQCVQFYSSTTKRNQDGRYIVRLPLKTNLEENLGSSKPMAIAQFRQLERKFNKNKPLADDYKLFIKEYRDLGHMIPATRADAGNTTPGYFMPHHGVLRPDSTTTTLRVVFNASAKTTSGHSLNDLMEAGPNLQQNLQYLILNWRQYQYAFTADIEKMFRQIKVHDDDQMYQKIIWRDTSQEVLREYQLTTVTYGHKAAPFLSMMTLKQLALDEKPNYHNSRAPKVIEESFYMDDLLNGSHTIPDAKQLQSDLIQLLKSGGFNLRKWRSNVPELIPIETIDQQTFDFKQPSSTKTLGLGWNPAHDVFTFSSKITTTTTHPTKRLLLSDISKVFDPLGWLSPVTTKLKLLFQTVWQSNIEWDEKLPGDICDEWTKITADINHINQMRVPRWLGTRETDLVNLHGFCDASTKAYAAVIYCKINHDELSPVTLVAGKARLVPASKTISLPRLELCAAVLLSKLMAKVKESLPNYKIQLYGWTDSMVVLGWLQGDPNRWKPFVANRVSQVTEKIPRSCWQYVKSEENPADCASRGISADQLNQHQLWWHGPKWLPSYTDQHQKTKFTTDMEIKNRNQINVVTKPADNIVQQIIIKYSTLTRAVRVLAWTLRAISRYRNQTPYLSLQELQKAEKIIIKNVQQLEFPNEINKLKNQECVDKKSKICNLKPFLDEKGILRVGGRLENAYIESEMKHPAIIPHTSKVTELLIDHAHNATFHGGARVTSAYLRQRYWIVGGNRVTKKQLRLCVRCRRTDPVKHQQLMGDLPASRSNPSRPFYHTGVDFTGSILIKTKNGTMKRPIVKLSVLPVNPDHNEERKPQPDLTCTNHNQPAKEPSTSEKTPPRKTIRSKRSCNLLSLVLTLFMLLWTPISGNYHVSSLQNSNNMFYFDQISSMCLVRDEWKLIVYYDLQPYRQGNALFTKYIDHLETICSNSKIKTQCDVILLQLRQGYAEYDYYNTMLLNQQFTRQPRQRRGLINGVGSIAHTLFGVLDESFAEQYKKDIDLLQTNQQHLASLWKNQTSVVEAEYNLLKRAENTMDKQHKLFNLHLNSLEKAANDLKTGIQSVANSNDFVMSSIIATNILNNLRHIQDTLLETITNIFHGNFNIHLLKPEQLLQELNIITGHLSKDLSLPIDNIQTNLAKIYHVLKVKARVINEYVIFEIKIPLVSRDHYDIYKPIPISRDVNGTMVTLVPIATHIAMNLRKDMYLPLSDNDFLKCISFDESTQLCYLHGPLYQLDNDQSLCVKGQTTQNCKTNLDTCKQSWTQLQRINTYLFSCCGQCPIRIICGNMIVSERLSKAGVITLGEDCVIKGDSYTIVSHKQFSNRLDIHSELVTHTIPPINNIINVSMPNTTLELEPSGFEKDLRNIGNQINQLKEQQADISQISYHDVHHYSAIYVCIGIAVLGVIAWGCCRAHRRRAERRAARSDVDATYSASIQCVSVKNEPIASVSASTSDRPFSVSVSENKKGARVDKATSPSPRYHFANI